MLTALLSSVCTLARRLQKAAWTLRRLQRPLTLPAGEVTMSSNIKVRRVVASVVAASALGAAAPALAVEVAAASAPRTLPACCEGAVPEARERAETAAAPADARAARAARDVAQETERARADPFARHPHWEGP